MSDKHNAHRQVRVLFVCTGNTCRSVMAEGIARKKFGKSVEVSSVGLRPQQARDATTAIETLKMLFNVDMTGHIPQDIRSLDIDSFDYVIALDRYIAESLAYISANKLITWNISDPWYGDDSEYEKCALKIKQAISKLSLSDPKIDS